jgi:hypothetical protein
MGMSFMLTAARDVPIADAIESSVSALARRMERRYAASGPPALPRALPPPEGVPPQVACMHACMARRMERRFAASPPPPPRALPALEGACVCVRVCVCACSSGCRVAAAARAASAVQVRVCVCVSTHSVCVRVRVCACVCVQQRLPRALPALGGERAPSVAPSAAQANAAATPRSLRSRV